MVGTSDESVPEMAIDKTAKMFTLSPGAQQTCRIQLMTNLSDRRKTGNLRTVMQLENRGH